jgi:hypothetical protein
MRSTALLIGILTLALPICAVAQDHHAAAVQPDQLKWSAPGAYACTSFA